LFKGTPRAVPDNYVYKPEGLHARFIGWTGSEGSNLSRGFSRKGARLIDEI
jgi:hypothetical protein